jgi:hypothetical protein
MTDATRSDTPSSTHRFFIYDPQGWGFVYYASAEARAAAKDGIIQSYLVDGWDEDVQQIIAGEVTRACEKINVEHRPEQVDEEGNDEQGNYWAEEWSYKCDYDLLPLGQAEAVAA